MRRITQERRKSLKFSREKNIPYLKPSFTLKDIIQILRIFSIFDRRESL